MYVRARVCIFQEFDGKFLLSPGQKLFGAVSGMKERLKCSRNRYLTMANNEKSTGHYCTERNHS